MTQKDEKRRVIHPPAAGEWPSLALDRLHEGSNAMRMLARCSFAARFASLDPLPHASDSLVTAPSTDRSRRPNSRPTAPRPRRGRRWSRTPRPRPQTRKPTTLVACRTVPLTRVAAWVGRCCWREESDRRWAMEAAGRRREGAGPASQPPRVGQVAGGRPAGLKGTREPAHVRAP